MKIGIPTLFLLLVTGCGGDKPSDTADSPPAPDDTATETATPADTGDSANETGNPAKDTADTAIEDTGYVSETFEIAASDKALRYVGRWDHSDPDAPWAQWQSA